MYFTRTESSSRHSFKLYEHSEDVLQCTKTDVLFVGEYNNFLDAEVYAVCQHLTKLHAVNIIQ